MRVFDLRGEAKCAVCSTTKDVGHITLACESCGEQYYQICSKCAARPCKKCRGKLAHPDRIFPNSLFKAILDGDELGVDLALQDRKKLDLNKLSKDGVPALFFSAQGRGKSAVAIVDKLISLGASPHARDENGRTALIEAVRTRGAQGRKREVLSRLSASVNEKDNEGKTALMFAVQGAGMFGNPRVNLQLAQDLLSMGADPLIQDNRKRTALSHAQRDNKEGKNQDMVDFLEEKMLTAVALREFTSRNEYEFDKAGNLTFKPKKKPGGAKRGK